VLEYIAKEEEGKFGGLIDAVDYQGDTALNIAARVGNRMLVRTLLEAGADKLKENKLGLRATDYGLPDPVRLSLSFLHCPRSPFFSLRNSSFHPPNSPPTTSAPPRPPNPPSPSRPRKTSFKPSKTSSPPSLRDSPPNSTRNRPTSSRSVNTFKI
jgi:ankyrin repeat protein